MLSTPTGASIPTVDVEAHLKAVLETQPVVLLRVATDGTLLAVNEAGMAAMGGVALDQLLGKSFTSFLSLDDGTRFLEFVEWTAAGNRGSLEIAFARLTGTTHAFEVHAAPHPGASDGIPSVLVTVRDISEFRRLERSLVEAMAREPGEDSAHQDQLARLAADVEAAQQAQTEIEAHLAAARERAAELEERVRDVEAERTESVREAASARSHVADLEQHVRALEAERADIGQNMESARSRVADLEESVELLEAERADSAQQAEYARAQIAQLQQALAATKQASADSISDLESTVAALRCEADALAHANNERDAANAVRLSQLEAALASMRSAERASAARLRHVAHAAQNAARHLLDVAASAGRASGITAGELGWRIEASLNEVLGRGVSVTVAVAQPRTVVDAPFDVIEQALVALALDRAAVLGSSQISVEVAGAVLDDDAAAARGRMAAGEYVTVTMRVIGDAAAEGLPSDLFECTDPNVWARAGDSLSAAADTVRCAQGALWLAREGTAAVVFELYVPHGSDRAAPALDTSSGWSGEADATEQ